MESCRGNERRYFPRRYCHSNNNPAPPTYCPTGTLVCTRKRFPSIETNAFPRMCRFAAIMYSNRPPSVQPGLSRIARTSTVAVFSTTVLLGVAFRKSAHFRFVTRYFLGSFRTAHGSWFVCEQVRLLAQTAAWTTAECFLIPSKSRPHLRSLRTTTSSRESGSLCRRIPCRAVAVAAAQSSRSLFLTPIG